MSDQPDRTARTAPPTAAAKSVFGARFAAAAQARRTFNAKWAALPVPGRILIGLLLLAFVYMLPSLDLPLIPTTSDFTSLLAITIVPYVLVALGLNVVVGMAGLLDLGYVGFYATGAYALAILTSQHATIPWLIALPLSMLISMIAGVVLGAPTLRLRGDYLAIVTLGFGEIIRLLAKSSDWLGAASGVGNIKSPPNIGPIKFSGTIQQRNLAFYYLAVTLVVLTYFLLRRLELSRVGRSWTAIREDEDAAELMGVPTFKFKLWAFAIGAAIGGIAGTLYASNVRFINPDNFQLKLSILFLAAVILGGPGNMPGVIVGAIAVSYFPERLRFLDTSRYFWFGLVLMVMMIFRPQGLLPRKLRMRRREVEPPFVDAREGDPDLEGGAHGATIA
ncbi:MAG: branched-chain amino acid ABC transporter permease [Ilumatobacteraceae bacterium]